MNPNEDRRLSGQSVDSATKMRRRDTMRQVEVAAVMHMLDSHGMRSGSNSSGGGAGIRGSTSSASSSHLIGNGNSGRPSYQLSDTPSGRSSKPPQQQEIVTSNKKPETFADMVRSNSTSFNSFASTNLLLFSLE